MTIEERIVANVLHNHSTEILERAISDNEKPELDKIAP